MSLPGKLHEVIERHGLMHRDSLYLVALSGGADSVALLCCLQSLGYRLEAVHCNFHLRGDEADRDETFCRHLCQEMEIPIHVAHYDTRTYAQLHQVSIEMAARELRYRYFHQLLEDLHATDICVAHHRDDSVETVLMNLIRGTGLHGLTGISPRNGRVIRPMLDVSREEIEQYLRSIHQPYVTDSTNLVDDVVRNKIRLRLLPIMEEINPSIRESLHRMSLRLSEADGILENALEEKAREAIITAESSPLRIPSLSSDGHNCHLYDIAKIDSEYLLFHILSPYGFSSTQVEQVFSRMATAETGREWQSATHQLLIDRGRMLVETRETTPFRPLYIPEEGTYVYGEGRRMKVFRQPVDSDFRFSRETFRVTIDADKVVFPLTLRRVMAADRFQPSGMRGSSKLVNDFLTDAKLSLFDKRRQLIVVDATGKIIWVAGLRVDNRVLITPTTTWALDMSLTW